MAWASLSVMVGYHRVADDDRLSACSSSARFRAITSLPTRCSAGAAQVQSLHVKRIRSARRSTSPPGWSHGRRCRWPPESPMAVAALNHLQAELGPQGGLSPAEGDAPPLSPVRTHPADTRQTSSAVRRFPQISKAPGQHTPTHLAAAVAFAPVHLHPAPAPGTEPPGGRPPGTCRSPSSGRQSPSSGAWCWLLRVAAPLAPQGTPLQKHRGAHPQPSTKEPWTTLNTVAQALFFCSAASMALPPIARTPSTGCPSPETHRWLPWGTHPHRRRSTCTPPHSTPGLSCPSTG